MTCPSLSTSGIEPSRLFVEERKTGDPLSARPDGKHPWSPAG